MPHLRLIINGSDLKELNKKLLDIADSIALEYESYLQNPEEVERYWKEEGLVLAIDDITGEEIYGILVDPVVPQQHWSYILHSGNYRNETGKGICDAGVKK